MKEAQMNAEELARLIASTLADDETDISPYVDADYIEEVIIDGRFNLLRLAETLIKNGYGKLEDAWDEGRMAGSGLSVVSALLRPNPYRRPE